MNLVRKDTPFSLGDLKAIPLEAFHNRLQVFGYRLGAFAYLTDVKTIPDEEVEKIKGVKALCVNALRKDAHHSHFNLEEALEFIARVEPDVAYLTHISHHMGFHAEVEKELPPNVHLAYDNLILTL